MVFTPLLTVIKHKQMRRTVQFLFFLLVFPLFGVAQTYISPPYSTGFESGLDSHWTTITTAANSAVFINTNQTPHSGSSHLTMTGTQWWPVVYSTNSALLHLDLDSAIDVSITFYIEDYIEENHPENGVFFSDNSGSTFTKVMDYNGTLYTDDNYQPFSLNITALALANGLILSSNFIIKFQQYGYEPVGSDGISIDDVSVTQLNKLPIELLNFNVAPINKTSIKINWQTASEINNDFFTVERSTNGIEWAEIFRISGVGNSSDLLNYSVIDEDPYWGVSYYRLKQTDFDGKFEYSQIRSINFEKLKNTSIELFPNPVNHQLTIVGNETELKNITIYNTIGQDVTKLTKQIIGDESKIVVDLSNLNTGSYIIKTKTTANKVYKQ